MSEDVFPRRTLSGKMLPFVYGELRNLAAWRQPFVLLGTGGMDAVMLNTLAGFLEYGDRWTPQFAWDIDPACMKAVLQDRMGITTLIRGRDCEQEGFLAPADRFLQDRRPGVEFFFHPLVMVSGDKIGSSIGAYRELRLGVLLSRVEVKGRELLGSGVGNSLSVRVMAGLWYAVAVVTG
jgi:hypothetical protein